MSMDITEESDGSMLCHLFNAWSVSAKAIYVQKINEFHLKNVVKARGVRLRAAAARVARTASEDAERLASAVNSARQPARDQHARIEEESMPESGAHLSQMESMRVDW